MEPVFPYGFNLMFTIFPIFFIIVLGIILFNIFLGVKTYLHNNKQPIIPVESKVVSKRYKFTRHNNGGNMNMHHHSGSTSYYVTFELSNGERMELRVPSYEFGLMVEGDIGTLTFQGSRFISFTRNR